MKVSGAISNSTLGTLVRKLHEIIQVLNYQVSFGGQEDPESSGDHLRDNIEGQWVKKQVSNGTNTFTHNLDIQQVTSGTPNVAWIVFGIRSTNDPHSWTMATTSLVYHTGTVAADSIQLEWTGDTATLLVFFIPTGDW